MEGFFFRHDRADAADRHALVDDPVDGGARFGDELTNHVRIGAVVVEFEEAVQGPLHVPLDAVLLLVARANAERPFGEIAGAAQNGELFKNHGLQTLVGRFGRRGEAAQAAAHDHEVRVHDARRRKHGTREKARSHEKRSGRRQKESTLHGKSPFPVDVPFIMRAGPFGFSKLIVGIPNDKDQRPRLRNGPSESEEKILQVHVNGG